MSLYCLCEQQNDKPDSQAFMAPNRYCAIESSVGGGGGEHLTAQVTDFPPLALYVPMRCIKTGANQVLLEGGKRPNNWEEAARPPDWRRHYPNVDVYECPNCHARVAKEG